MRTVLYVLGAFALAFVVSAVFFPAFASDGLRAPEANCLSNVKKTSLGLILYAGDENDRFALRDEWMDAIYPYTKTRDILHCPSVPKGAYGYAFNGALSGAKSPKDAVATPLVYDSVNPIRNASDLYASLPRPGRHDGKNSVAYADGHSRRVVVQ